MHNLIKSFLAVCFFAVMFLLSTSARANEGKRVQVRPCQIYEQMDEDKKGESGVIYVIKNKCNLKGRTIRLAENCTLFFEGGRIKNGVIVFNNTLIEGEKPVFENVSISGSIRNHSVTINWFNVKDNISKVMPVLIGSPSVSEIIIPKGEYLVTDPILLRSNLTIRGEGEGSVLLADRTYRQRMPNKYVMFSTVRQKYIIQGSRSCQLDKEEDYCLAFNNIKLSNLCFDLNYSGGDNVGGQMAAVKIEDAKNVTIENCWFKDRSIEGLNHTYHAVYFVKSKDCKVAHCNTKNISFVQIIKSEQISCISNFGKNSIGTWLESNDGSNLLYSNNTLDGVTSLTSAISFNSRNCIAEYNTIRTTTPIVCGIVLGHSNSFDLDNNADGCTVRNNTFEILGSGKNDYGVLIQNAKRARIIGNNVTSTGNTVRVSDGNDAVIEENTLTLANVAVSNLYLNTTNEMTVTNNTITDNGKGIPQNYNPVIYVACKKASLTNNRISTKAQGAKCNVIWTVPGDRVQELVILDNDCDGISLMGHVRKLNVSGNTFKNVSTHLFTNSVNREGTTRQIIVKNNIVTWRDGNSSNLVYLTGKVENGFKPDTDIQVEDNKLEGSQKGMVRYSLNGDKLKGIKEQKSSR